MKRAEELHEIRNLLSATVHQLGERGLSSREIIVEFRKLHRREIARVSGALEDIALIKLVSDVSYRRPAATLVPGQGDLFAGYSVPSAVAIPIPGAKELQRKAFSKLTYGEVVAWYKDHAKERAANTRRLQAVRRLLDRIRPFMKSGEMTIEEGLAAAEIAEAKTKERSAKH